MRDKHPIANGELLFNDMDICNETHLLTEKQIQMAIVSFPKGSAPGPTSLRPQHLLDALKSNLRFDYLQQLTGISNTLTQGKAPAILSKFLAGATLIGNPKKDKNDLRPIAIGETLRRLISKALCRNSCSSVKDYLWPLQLGVNISNGSEIAIHTLRNYHEKSNNIPNKVVLKLDMKNAFNTISRKCCIDQVKNHIPQVQKWIQWCYSQPSRLLLGEHVIMSESGVQQGDPFGSLLFAMGLQPILIELKSQLDLDLFYAYEDDIIVAGNYQDVAMAFKLLKEKCSEIDLELKNDKCELILLSQQNHNLSLFPDDIQVLENGEFEYLGAPIGSQNFCNKYVESKVRKLDTLFNKIPDMEESQLGYFLLKNCMSFGKMVYLCRVTPPSLHIDALKMFDDRIRACFETISGIHANDLQWNKATLGIKLGGIGFRKSQVHCNAAYIASLTTCAPKCKELIHDFNGDCLDDDTHLNLAIRNFNSKIQELDRITLHNLNTLKQRDLSDILDRNQAGIILKNSDILDKAHYNLETSPKSGSWLNTIPCESLNHFIPNVLFTIMLKRRLRVPLFQGSNHCTLCDQQMDVYGDHALVCSTNGDRNYRHNAIRNKAYFFCQQARLNPVMEKIGLLRNQSLEKLRPADIFIPNFKHGQPTALDFAVTSGLQSNYVENSSFNNNFAKEEYTLLKKNSNDTNLLCKRNDIKYIPMVIEGSGGSWSYDSEEVWKIVIRNIATLNSDSISNVTNSLYQCFSIIVAKSNARSILKRSPYSLDEDQIKVSAISLIGDE